MEGLIFGGAYLRREICFTLYLRAIFQVQAPGGGGGGLYLEGRFNGGIFELSDWGDLYLEGLIHGGAYFRNFTVFRFIRILI